MVIPLFDDGEALNWSIGLHREPHAFSPDLVEEFILRGTHRSRDAKPMIQKELDELTQFSEQNAGNRGDPAISASEVTPKVSGLEIATFPSHQQTRRRRLFRFF